MSLGAPYVVGSKSSKDAAQKILPYIGKMHRDVLQLFIEVYPGGLTREEARDRNGGLHQTLSARLNELVGAGVLAHLGEYRRTREGSSTFSEVLVLSGTISEDAVNELKRKPVPPTPSAAELEEAAAALFAADQEDKFKAVVEWLDYKAKISRKR